MTSVVISPAKETTVDIRVQLPGGSVIRERKRRLRRARLHSAHTTMRQFA